MVGERHLGVHDRVDERVFFFFSSRRRHTRCSRDWSSDVCSSDLFLMARTPGGPITKEIKPAAAIAWKRLGYGEILRGGRPVPLYDVDPAQAETLAPGAA